MVIPRDRWLEILSQMQNMEHLILEIPLGRRQEEVTEFRSASAHLEKARRQIDQGNYDGSGISCGHAVEAVEKLLPEGGKDESRIRKFVTTALNDKRAVVYGNAVSVIRNLRNSAAHEYDPIPLTRSEALLALSTAANIVALDRRTQREREAMTMDEKEELIVSTTAESVTQVGAIALNAIPVVGGVLSDIANTVISKRQNRRLNEFLITLANEFQEFQNRVNSSFLQTGEFQDLAEDVFGKAAETRQQEKLDSLRAIFLNTIISDRPSYAEASEIIELVNRWQPRHLVLLRILADPVAADRQMSRVVGSGGGIATSINQILQKLLPEWDDDQIERTWQDLYQDRIHRTQGTKSMMTDRGIHQLEGRLTEFAQKVLKYISRPAGK